MTRQRLRLEIHGAVQGVGFRPFVYRLAAQLALTGWVINDTRGVFIEVEGPASALKAFLERLAAQPPPRAVIHSLHSRWLEPAGYQQFEIRHSQETGAKTALVLPDIATCADCLAEVFDAADRHYGYPFTNCTNCGPRFTIIQALPYDRPNTTMQHFTMCPACQAEYDAPTNRRFHAQPNACPVCGPRVELRSATNEQPAATTTDDVLRTVAAALQAGQIVAVKGLGGFHLMVDACNEAAVVRLRERKPRREKPFALMVRDLEQAHTFCHIPPQDEALLTAAEAPVVLLRRRPEAPIAAAVAPNNPLLGVMLPATPLHHLLLHRLAFPVVATSGNLSDEPICIDNAEAVQRLGHIADLFLMHNRPIERHTDDSIAWIIEDAPQLLRRARGYAPLPVLVAHPLPPILAVGAHLKNTVALSVERQVFISQHIGDLETPEAMAAFERVIADFLRLYEAAPVAIAHDMHPDYLSTRHALQWQATHPAMKLIAVQHHHAHLAACLAEHGVDGPALGIIWDGTGYGSDGTVWGGEFLLGDAGDVQRVAHLRPFRLPGGDAAVREPRRVALALLWELYGAAALERHDLPAIQSFQPAERRVLAQMLQRSLNAPVTTSAGRLFDGVAALIGMQQQVSFEGQAAMALEFAADATVTDAYPYALVTNDQHAPLILDWRPLIEALLEDLRGGKKTSIIAARFHNALVEAIGTIAQMIGESRVVLSGGCFQNRLLSEQTARRLRAAGFTVLLHRQVPPNDGGISLGQVAVAARRLIS